MALLLTDQGRLVNLSSSWTKPCIHTYTQQFTRIHRHRLRGWFGAWAPMGKITRVLSTHINLFPFWNFLHQDAWVFMRWCKFFRELRYCSKERHFSVENATKYRLGGRSARTRCMGRLSAHSDPLTMAGGKIGNNAREGKGEKKEGREGNERREGKAAHPQKLSKVSADVRIYTCDERSRYCFASVRVSVCLSVRVSVCPCNNWTSSRWAVIFSWHLGELSKWIVLGNDWEFVGNFLEEIFHNWNVGGNSLRGNVQGNIQGTCLGWMSKFARKITSLYVQLLWFVTPGLTHRHTHRHIHSFNIIFSSTLNRLRNDLKMCRVGR